MGFKAYIFGFEVCRPTLSLFRRFIISDSDLTSMLVYYVYVYRFIYLYIHTQIHKRKNLIYADRKFWVLSLGSLVMSLSTDILIKISCALLPVLPWSFSLVENYSTLCADWSFQCPLLSSEETSVLCWPKIGKVLQLYPWYDVFYINFINYMTLACM